MGNVVEYAKQVTQNYSNHWSVKKPWAFEKEELKVTPKEIANKMVQHCQFFDVSEIYKHAFEITGKIYPDKNVPPSTDAILPAPYTALYIDYNSFDDVEGKEEIIVYLSPTNQTLGSKNFSIITIKNPETEAPRLLGEIKTKLVNGKEVKSFCLASTALAESKKNPRLAYADSLWIRQVSTLLHLINKPRKVKINPLAQTRQAKRQIARGMGFAVDAWHRVSWDIDKPVVAKEPYDKKFHNMPLHFNRGHWKKALKHHPKSVQRDAENGWWTWVEGYWAGHPAFGIKKTYHVPKRSTKL
tara:strand:+ start:24 stop:920 length:897 start_codon:yes stop_codon:yes gene_type:complete